MLEQATSTEWRHEALASRSIVSARLGRHEAALADAQAAISLAPQHAGGHFTLAFSYFKRGDTTATRASLAQAQALPVPPNLTDNELTPAQYEAKWLGAVAVLRMALGAADSGSANGTADLELAVTLLERAAALDPANKQHRQRLAQAHYQAGKAAQGRGELAAALAAFQRAVAADPSHGLAHNSCGVVLLQQGKDDAALRCFQRAAQLRPEDKAIGANVAATEGHLALQGGNHVAAAACFQRAAELRPDDMVVAANVACAEGHLALQGGNHAAAAACFQRAVELQPANATYRQNLASAQQGVAKAAAAQGEAAMERRDYAAAAAAFARANQLSPCEHYQQRHAKALKKLNKGDGPSAGQIMFGIARVGIAIATAGAIR